MATKIKSQKSTKSTKNIRARLKRSDDARYMKFVSEALGWYGAAAILIAFGLASFDLLNVKELPYQLLNFTGAIGVLTVATAKHVRQSMLINAFWALMAGIALIRIVLQV